MDFLKNSFCVFAILLLNACEFKYILKSGFYQADLLRSRIPLEKILNENTLTENEKNRIILALKVLDFADKELDLNTKKNYRTYVKLDRNYVSYALSAAEKYSLTPFLWNFPIVGSLPYKGFFNKDDALTEEKKLKDKYDTHVRGVSAYSTLGWFNDPILSSMLNYEESDFVDLLIHESTHATIYFKSQADFNENLATFYARIGTNLFYKDNPKMLKLIDDKIHDENLFSQFINESISDLELFYKENQDLEKNKKNKMDQITQKFIQNVKPKLKTDSYLRFEKLSLNNAILLGYKTYISDLSVFESAFNKLGKNPKEFIKFCKKQEGSSDPLEEFKKL